MNYKFVRGNIRIAVPNPNENVTHLDVRVRYDKGGMCYSTYKTKPRGYYLSVQPIAVEEPKNSDGFATERYVMFSGSAMLLEETKRLNGKRLQALWNKAKDEIVAEAGQAWDLAVKVAAGSHITLKAAEPVPA